MPTKGKGDDKPSKTVVEESAQVGNDKPTPNHGNARPTTGIDRTKISPKALKMAKELGVPLEPIFEWAESVDARFQAIQEHLEPAIQQAIEKTLVNLQRKAVEDQKKAMHAAIERGEMPRQPTRGGSPSLMDIIPLLTGGGGGMDAEMIALQKDMMRVGINSVKEDIGFTRAIKNAFVQKLTGKVIGKSLDEV